MKAALKSLGRSMVAPIGRALDSLGISANAVTVAGALAAFPAAYGFYVGDRVLAFSALLASALADLLDGAVARARGGPGTRFGAALDSSLDRYGEGLVFGGLVVGLATRSAPEWLIAVGVLAGVGSFLVSYVRARSEGLGIACEVGVLERPERLALLLVLAAWGDSGAQWILPAIAVLAHVTFVQRLVRVHQAARAGESDP